jgi:outer membrane lipoprotein SlyB
VGDGVGEAVGAAVGALVGELVGCCVGTTVGETVGAVVGESESVGVRVALSTRAKAVLLMLLAFNKDVFDFTVRALLGPLVGLVVGEWVSFVGYDVGLVVGNAVGNMVGACVGVLVGAIATKTNSLVQTQIGERNEMHLTFTLAQGMPLCCESPRRASETTRIISDPGSCCILKVVSRLTKPRVCLWLAAFCGYLIRVLPTRALETNDRTGSTGGE